MNYLQGKHILLEGLLLLCITLNTLIKLRVVCLKCYDNTHNINP